MEFEQKLDAAYRFFAISFNAAAGVTFLRQITVALQEGASVQGVVNEFTKKQEFLSVYRDATKPENHDFFANTLINNVVGNLASETAKSQAYADIIKALRSGASPGDVVFAVFTNLAELRGDATWGRLAKKLDNQVAVSRYYTEVLRGDSTDPAVLRALLKGVDDTTDVSPEALQFRLNPPRSLTANADTPGGSDIDDTYIAAEAGHLGSTDTTLDSIAAGGGTDQISILGAGSITDNAFTRVTGVENLRLAGGASVVLGPKAAAAGLLNVGIDLVAASVDLKGFNAPLAVTGSGQADTVTLSLLTPGQKTLVLGGGQDQVVVDGAPTTPNGVAVRQADGRVTVTGPLGLVSVAQDGLTLTNKAGANIFNYDPGSAELRGPFAHVVLGTAGAEGSEVLRTDTTGGALASDSGHVFIDAGAGQDTIEGAAAAGERHVLLGGEGNDTIRVSTAAADAQVVAVGGPGTDNVSVLAVPTNGADGTVRVDLSAGTDSLVSFAQGTLRLNQAAASSNDTVLGGAGSADTLAAHASDLMAVPALAAGASRTVSGVERLVVQGQLNATETVTTGTSVTPAVQSRPLDLTRIGAGIRDLVLTEGFTDQSAVAVGALDGAYSLTLGKPSVTSTTQTINGSTFTSTFSHKLTIAHSGAGSDDSITLRNGAATAEGAFSPQPRFDLRGFERAVVQAGETAGLSGQSLSLTFSPTTPGASVSIAVEGSTRVSLFLESLSLGGVGTYVVDASKLKAGAGFSSGLSVIASSFFGSTSGKLDVTGSQFGDSLSGTSLADTLRGGAGNDLLAGNGGADVLDGGAGADDFSFSDSLGQTGPVSFSQVSLADGAEGVDRLSWNLSGPSTAQASAVTTVVDSDFAALRNFEQFSIQTSNFGNPVQGVNLTLGSNASRAFAAGFALSYGMTTYDAVVDASQLTVALSATSGSGSGADSIIGTNAPDSISSGAGNDTLFGGGGADSLQGGAGNDTIRVTSAADMPATEAIDGGEGIDELQLISTSGQVFTLPDGLVGVEAVRLLSAKADGTGFDDAGTSADGINAEKVTNTGPIVLSGNAGPNVLLGHVGANTILGGAGNDFIYGGGGNDRLDGGAGDDEVLVRVAELSVTKSAGVAELRSTIAGGEGNDTLTFQSTDGLVLKLLPGNLMGIERVRIVDASESAAGITAEGIDASALAGSIRLEGNAGANRLTGNGSANTLAGGAGDDILDGKGNDTAPGGADMLLGGDGNDEFIIFGAEGNGDTMDGGAGLDRIRFTPITGTATLTLGAALTSVEEVLVEGTSAGTVDASAVTYALLIQGNGSGNVLTGGAGNDVVNGGAGSDALVGGAGNDELVADVATDSINGGAGTDTWRLAPASTTAPVDLSGILASRVTEVERLVLGNAGQQGVSLKINSADLANSFVTGKINTVFGVAGGVVEQVQVTAAAASANIDASAVTVTDAAFVITGSTGADTLKGANSNDSITGGGGADTITGGAGADLITLSTDGATNVVQTVVQNAGDSLAPTLGGTIASVAGAVLVDLATLNLAAADTIVNFAVGDRIDIPDGMDPAGLSGATYQVVANGVPTVLGAGTVGVADNMAAYFRGTVSATNGFTVSATGADTLLIFDANPVPALTSFQVVLLKGYTGGLQREVGTGPQLPGLSTEPLVIVGGPGGELVPLGG